MDVSQYLEIFLDETKEHLQNLNTQILDLEQDPENMDTIISSNATKAIACFIFFITTYTPLCKNISRAYKYNIGKIIITKKYADGHNLMLLIYNILLHICKLFFLF